MVAEGGVGYALELGVWIDRRARQFDRYGQPPPRRGDRSEGYQKKRQRRAKRNQFRPPGTDRRSTGMLPRPYNKKKSASARIYLTSESCTMQWRQLAGASPLELYQNLQRVRIRGSAKCRVGVEDLIEFKANTSMRYAIELNEYTPSALVALRCRRSPSCRVATRRR